MKIDGMADAIINELSSWSREVVDALKEECTNVADDAAKQLRDISPKRRGAYARDWASKVTYQDWQDIRVTVYNKRHYQLTHLLENGHAKVNGGRVSGIPHISIAEDAAAKELEEKVKVRINRL